jgi:tetratricopeptide (TPR) repeat protein
VWTDASESTARELVARMEDLRQAVIGIGFRGADRPGRSLVIALRDDDEVGAFLPQGDFRAVASYGGATMHQPMILLSANPARDPKGTVTAHELTHTISHAVIRRQPRWFAEGLAKFFETIEIDRRAGTIDLGRGPTYRGEPLRMRRMIPLAKLFACKSTECTDGSFYVTAWALFTYAFNRYPQQLAQYEDLLASGTPSEKAWQTAFGAIPLETLEAEMRQWIAHGSHTVLHFNARLKSWPVSVSPLDDADVYATRAMLRMQFQEGRETEARKLLDEALAIDPTHPLARWLEYKLTEKPDAEIAKKVIAAHPDDWRGWFILAAATKDREAIEKVCALASANPLVEVGCPTAPAATSRSPDPS